MLLRLIRRLIWRMGQPPREPHGTVAIDARWSYPSDVDRLTGVAYR